MCSLQRQVAFFILKLIEFVIFLSDEDICRAARDGDVKEVRRLVEVGHNVNQRDGKWSTPLMWAAERGHTDCVKFLLQNGAQLYLNNDDYRTALDLASEKGHDLIQTAINKGE